MYVNKKSDIRFSGEANIIWVTEKYQHDPKFKTFLLHEIGHIILNHRISDLKEECEADTFCINNGGRIEYLLKVLDNIDENYYGEYIREPYLRKLLLLLKLIIKIKKGIP